MFADRRFAKNIKTCSLKYKTRKILEIFYKNGVYRFAVLVFSIFRINSKMNVRLSFTINTWLIYTLKQIREIVRWLTVRENSKSCLLKYKTRKIIEIFLKNRVYRFAVLDFSIFGQTTKLDVRSSFTVNTWPIYTLGRIREIVRWLSFRKNTRKLFAKM